MPLLYAKNHQFFDGNGDPLASGTLTFYQVGTSTPTTIYTTSAYDTAHSNPLTLNSEGRPATDVGTLSAIWAKDLSLLRVLLKNSAGTTISDDPVMGDILAPLTIVAVDDGTSADLKSTQGSVDGQIAITRGYYTSGDGGHGMYRWDSSSTSTDDGGTIHQVVGVTTGRWKLLYSEEVNVKQFGCKGDNSFDETTRLTAARDFIAGLSTPVELKFPPGIYRYTVSPNWAIQDAKITACGEVRLRYTGTGNAVIFDGGASPGAGVYNVTFGRFLVEAPSSALNGIYCRALHQSEIKAKVLGAGTLYAGLLTEWCVLTNFYVSVSVNHEGWYSSAQPKYGCFLSKRDAGETTSYCNFYDCAWEGVANEGISLSSTLGNNFFGGTSEGCGTYGVYVGTDTLGDKFWGVDIEANGTLDVYCQGNNIEFNGCDTGYPTGATAVINIGSSANLCKIIGGSHSQITIDGTASGTIVAHTIYNRLNDSSTITNAGARTRLVDNIDAANDTFHLTGSATYDPASLGDGAGATTTVTVTGAALGDFAVASFSNDLQGILLTAWVSSANTVSVRFQNESTATVDLASGTIRASVLKPGI